MKLKDSSNSASQALTSTDAQRLVRETLRISANLASAPRRSTEALDLPVIQDPTFGGAVARQFLESSLRLICCEEIDGRRWNYFAENVGVGSRGPGQSRSSGSHQLKRSSIRAVSLQASPAPAEEFMSFLRSYVVPEGFPHSVAPSYVPYMTWRALQHFFGGAISVFTTQTLLSAVGLSRNKSAPSAVAINWILKDGAGRIGKMLFARQGKKFDYELKQLRWTGDLLLELGASLELVTAAFPHQFLPLACAANVLKNVAAVTAMSTRAPIYKAFAKGENIGDVTAKGECVGNIADLLGTGLGIMLAKSNPSLVPTFAVLSSGYLFSSFQEVKSVVLDTLTRGRFTLAVESFLKTGRVPTLEEGNVMENIISLPWKDHRPIVLGSRFKDAFQDPNLYISMEPIFEKERYIVTYNPRKGNIYALFKEKAKADDILKAVFHAHVLLYIIQSSNQNMTSSSTKPHRKTYGSRPTSSDLESHVTESYKMALALYVPFKNKAREKGWVMLDSLLNPGRARLCELDN